MFKIDISQIAKLSFINLLLSLGGCSSTLYDKFLNGKPLPTWYKTESSLAEIHQTELSCANKALEEVPIKIARRIVYGGSYVPRHSYRYCFATPRGSQCSTTSSGGYYTPPVYESYDANKQQRQVVKNDCMKQLGFSYITLPACPKGTTPTGKDNLHAVTVKLPPISSNICYIVESRDREHYQIGTLNAPLSTLPTVPLDTPQE